MKYLSIILCACLSPFFANGAELAWSGSPEKIIQIDAPASSGLDAVYVLDGLSGVKAAYASPSAAGVKWFRYSNLGGGYAEELSGVRVDGGSSILDVVEGDMGYIIEDGNERHYFWVVDYSRHELALSGITEAEERDCDRIGLTVAGKGDEIVYYSINGRRLVLSRDLQLDYTSLSYDEDSKSYVQVPEEATFEYLPTTLHVEAPLCATDFTLTGDRFLKEWGREISVSSSTVQPFAVQAQTSAIQTERSNDNEIVSGSGGDLGGSAPCEIEFSAAVTDAAIFTEWQFSSYPEFEDVDIRMSELNVTHTFTEEGMTYVRFVCANASGECEYYGPTYEISIGASSLKCPNAFSPGNADGVNDEWKVSYSSIVDFECHIFNRHGQKMASFSDPAQGWDGKYKGKLVPAGVYYYVITARGADGKKYNLSGDINIVNYK